MWLTELASEWDWGFLLAVAEPVPKKTKNSIVDLPDDSLKMVNGLQTSQSLKGVIFTVTMFSETMTCNLEII